MPILQDSQQDLENYVVTNVVTCGVEGSCPRSVEEDYPMLQLKIPTDLQTRMFPYKVAFFVSKTWFFDRGSILLPKLVPNGLVVTITPMYLSYARSLLQRSIDRYSSGLHHRSHGNLQKQNAIADALRKNLTFLTIFDTHFQVLPMLGVRKKSPYILGSNYNVFPTEEQRTIGISTEVHYSRMVDVAACYLRGKLLMYEGVDTSSSMVKAASSQVGVVPVVHRMALLPPVDEMAEGCQDKSSTSLGNGLVLVEPEAVDGFDMLNNSIAGSSMCEGMLLGEKINRSDVLISGRDIRRQIREERDDLVSITDSTMTKRKQLLVTELFRHALDTDASLKELVDRVTAFEEI